MPDSPPVLPDAILGPGPSAENAGPAETSLETRGGAESVGPLSGNAGGVREGGILEAARPGTEPSCSDSPTLTKKARDTALIAQRDARIRKKATDIVLSALRAPETVELPENALQSPPQGWTKRQLRIALDATNSMKAAPAYLGMAQRILESYRKAEAETSRPAPVLNATQVVVHQEFHYPTIKVER